MKQILFLGLDIGGANTKAVLIHFKNQENYNSFSYIEYFPFWKKTKDQFPLLLKRIISKIILNNNFTLENLNYIAVTMTAELSDAFQTKKEGILYLLNGLLEVFEVEKLRFITINNNYIGYKEAKNNIKLIMAANWVSTALYLGSFISDCILIDSGSTTTDIIPICKSLPIPIGKDDIGRLINHELIYTGGLRATIPSITHIVPYKNKMIRISFERFALISDIHMILNNISKEEYNNETADNRDKSIEGCYARLARVVCMDLNTVSKKELDIIAEYIYIKQLEIIKKEIKKFLINFQKKKPEFCVSDHPFIITGLSAEFLIEKALKELEFKNIKSYKDITNIPDNINSSAFAVAGALYNQLISQKNE